MAEKQVPLPLSGDEVREAIHFQLEQTMLKSCHLADTNAYSSFKAEITVKLVLNDLGRYVNDNHVALVGEGEVTPESKTVEAAVEVPEKAPNQVRVDTGQDVPVKAVVEGKTVIRKQKYAPRKVQK
jgi:hypothetical protein